MNIRPKIPIYLNGGQSGIRYNISNPESQWRPLIFDQYRLHILDQLAKYGKEDDAYGNWLNNMQTDHAKLYTAAGGDSNVWRDIAYKHDNVADYQRRYRGDFTKFQPISGYNFNESGIRNALNNNRYVFFGPSKRIEQDRGGSDYKVDGLYSAITDDRRLLGRKGDWDENGEDFKNWQNDLRKSGWQMYLDKDNYYKLRRLNSPLANANETLNPDGTPIEGTINGTPSKTESSLTGTPYNGKDFNLKNFTKDLQGLLPNILSGVRLANTLSYNDRIYDAKLKGIKPNLLLTFKTHYQVKGDEATKQGYYNRAALGLTKAARPFTSDADKLVAYMNEAKRVGDELRAQGDLADNQEIRRTSDISNEHEWKNTERENLVANNNITEMNRAFAAKQDIIALKLAARGSSWDNYLKEKLYNILLKNAEDKALQRQIWAILDLGEIEDELYPLKKAALDAMDSDDPKIRSTYPDKIRIYKTRKRELELELYERMRERNNKFGIYSAASGMKFTHKRKDDLLYKSAKDVVEHFRKMSKMSDDSTQRSYRKHHFRITPAPSTRKMQLGGVAPFLVYTPVALGGETTTSSQVSSSTATGTKSENSKGKEVLDLVKSLFNKVEGLPVDVNGVYSSLNKFFAKALAFGEDLDTNDIASIYLQSMLQLSNLKYSKDVYDKAKAFATSNDALGEFAVTADGKYVAQDKEGNLKEVTLEQLSKEKLNPITNQQLLNLRAYHPDLMFRSGDHIIENVIGNGMGINKIGALIKALAGSIGSSEKKLEGITQVEANRVKQGLQILQGLPDGNYKTTQLTKELSQLAKAALNYIKGMLSPSLKAILDIHGGTDYMIANFLSSLMSSTNEFEIQPLTGKATSDGNSSNGKGNAENSAGLAFVLGQGPRELIDFNVGTSNAIRVLGIKGVLLTHSKENLGQGATLQDATKSQLGGYLQWSKATFGGSRLNSLAYSHIILNDSTIMGMDLPYTKDINGNEVPDFLMTKKMEAADLEVLQNNIYNPEDINKIYLKYGLPAKFDSNGNLNTMQYKRFAAIQVTLDEDSLLNKDAILSDEIALAGEVERDLYAQAMKKSDKNYDISDGMWITGWGRDLIYKGTIFVPYSEDIAFAAVSSGEPFKQNLPDNAATIQQTQYAPKASKYTAPDVTLSQIKNN